MLVNLVSDTRGINKGVGEVNSKLSSLGKTIGKLGIGLGIAAAAKVAVDYVGDAIGKAKELEESQSRLDAVYGDSAREVRRWAADNATAYRLSNREAARALGDIGSLFKGAGLAGDELAAAATLATEAVGDIASAANLSSVESLQKVMAGLSGEVEPLRRIGIDLSVKNVENIAEQLGVDDLPLVQQRLAALQFQADNLNITGDSERTLDSATGKAEQLRVKLDNLQTDLGGVLLPLQVGVTEFLIGIADALQTAIDNLEGILDAGGFLLQSIGKAFDDFNKRMGESAQGQEIWQETEAFLSQQQQFYRMADAIGLTNDQIADLTYNTAEYQLVQQRLADDPNAGEEFFANLNSALQQQARDIETAKEQAGRWAEYYARQRTVHEEGGNSVAEAITGVTGSIADAVNGIKQRLDSAVNVELFDFDFGSPTEWVKDINKQLKEANVELKNFLTNPKAQRSLEAGISTMNARMERLLNKTAKAANLDSAGGSLMAVFGASVLAKTNKAVTGVQGAMELLGTKGHSKFVAQFSSTPSDILKAQPSTTQMSGRYYALGLAARTGFLRGFGNPVPSGTGLAGQTGGAADTRSVAPLTINIAGDPAVIEAAVMRSLRHSGMANGAVQMSDRLHKARMA